MIDREENILNLVQGGIVGRDPIGKTITEGLAELRPDWTDEQIAQRINREYVEPVITVEEVARWRSAAAQ